MLHVTVRGDAATPAAEGSTTPSPAELEQAVSRLAQPPDAPKTVPRASRSVAPQVIRSPLSMIVPFTAPTVVLVVADDGAPLVPAASVVVVDARDDLLLLRRSVGSVGVRQRIVLVPADTDFAADAVTRADTMFSLGLPTQGPPASLLRLVLRSAVTTYTAACRPASLVVADPLGVLEKVAMLHLPRRLILIVGSDEEVGALADAQAGSGLPMFALVPRQGAQGWRSVCANFAEHTAAVLVASVATLVAAGAAGVSLTLANRVLVAVSDDQLADAAVHLTSGAIGDWVTRARADLTSCPLRPAEVATPLPDAAALVDAATSPAAALGRAGVRARTTSAALWPPARAVKVARLVRASSPTAALASAGELHALLAESDEEAAYLSRLPHAATLTTEVSPPRPPLLPLPADFCPAPLGRVTQGGPVAMAKAKASFAPALNEVLAGGAPPTPAPPSRRFQRVTGRAASTGDSSRIGGGGGGGGGSLLFAPDRKTRGVVRSYREPSEDDDVDASSPQPQPKAALTTSADASGPVKRPKLLFRVPSAKTASSLPATPPTVKVEDDDDGDDDYYGLAMEVEHQEDEASAMVDYYDAMSTQDADESGGGGGGDDGTASRASMAASAKPVVDEITKAAEARAEKGRLKRAARKRHRKERKEIPDLLYATNGQLRKGAEVELVLFRQQARETWRRLNSLTVPVDASYEELDAENVAAARREPGSVRYLRINPTTGVLERDLSLPFRHVGPREANFMYYAIIPKPLDLMMIYARLSKYQAIETFVKDYILMLQNAFKFYTEDKFPVMYRNTIDYTNAFTAIIGEVFPRGLYFIQTAQLGPDAHALENSMVVVDMPPPGRVDQSDDDTSASATASRRPKAVFSFGARS